MTEWHIAVPTGFHFLTRYLSIIRASDCTRYLAAYYAERNLQEKEIFSYSPKFYAAAAVYAALKQQNTQYPNLFPSHVSPWSTKLEDETGYSEEQLIPLASSMISHVAEEPLTNSKRKLWATKKKYQSSKYENVASLALPEFPPTFGRVAVNQ